MKHGALVVPVSNISVRLVLSSAGYTKKKLGRWGLLLSQDSWDPVINIRNLSGKVAPFTRRSVPAGL